MATTSNNSQSGGIGLGGALLLLFIGLKLTGYINWSWWWVLSPIWIGFGVVAALLIIAAIIAAIVAD